MANNRLYLHNKRTGKKFYLAKYYPSTGWYIPDNETESLLNRFNEANISQDGKDYTPYSMWGCEWELEYEISE